MHGAGISGDGSSSSTEITGVARLMIMVIIKGIIRVIHMMTLGRGTDAMGIFGGMGLDVEEWEAGEAGEVMNGAIIQGMSGVKRVMSMRGR